jgi:hypothetical protein
MNITTEAEAVAAARALRDWIESESQRIERKERGGQWIAGTASLYQYLCFFAAAGSFFRLPDAPEECGDLGDPFADEFGNTPNEPQYPVISHWQTDREADGPEDGEDKSRPPDGFKAECPPGMVPNGYGGFCTPQEKAEQDEADDAAEAHFWKEDTAARRRVGLD